jgi:hypothetical protein
MFFLTNRFLWGHFPRRIKFYLFYHKTELKNTEFLSNLRGGSDLRSYSRFNAGLIIVLWVYPLNQE